MSKLPSNSRPAQRTVGFYPTSGLIFSVDTLVVLEEYDYAFAENGLTAYKLGQQLPSQSFINFVGEERYKPLVNFILHYIADLDLPIKRYI